MVLPTLIGYRDSVQTIKHSFDDNVTITLIGQIRRDHFEIDQKREILQHREIFWWKTQNSVRPNGLNDGFMYVCRYVLVYACISSRIFDNVIAKWTFCVHQFFSAKTYLQSNHCKNWECNHCFFSSPSSFFFSFPFSSLLWFSRLFTVPYFFVRSFRYTASYRHGFLDFQMYRGGGRRGL